ncbi:MAG: Type 1 glutamine amidotransferase-like domain-containing protein [Dehalococcoidales bacterium]|nr:Type 1 glutamine amidotransferase-like domain-containing protein [Dehalococcoidales bacterium]
MMNDKKPIYLLAGGRPSNRKTLDYLIQAVFRESGRASPTLAYVGTANEDNEGFFNRMADIFREVGAYKINHAMISPRRANLTKARDILKSAEIVFISGGDVDRGMQILNEKNMTDFLSELYEQGKLFFGISAGSVMLAKEWVRWRDPDDDSTAELFPCLGFAPIICDTHDEGDGWGELKAALRLEQDNVKGYGIVSGAAIKVFPDGKVEALGGAIHQYIRRGKRVYKSPDILPLSGETQV